MEVHRLINVGLLVVLVVCMFESYYGWVWSLVATGAAVTLIRPWLPAETPTRRSAEPP